MSVNDKPYYVIPESRQAIGVAIFYRKSNVISYHLYNVMLLRFYRNFYSSLV